MLQPQPCLLRPPACRCEKCGLGLGDLPPWKVSLDSISSRGQPVLHVTELNGNVQVDTIAVRDRGHGAWYIALRGEGSRYSTQISISQPFADFDLVWFDAGKGSVGIVRRSGSPGEVEVFEVSATGDTIWHRRLSLSAIPLSDGEAKQAIEDNYERFRSASESGGHELAVAELREIAETAVHVPSHLPAVTRVVATASGEIWLRTPEVQGEEVVWYSLKRGERDSEPRRVMIAATFRLMDVVEDHVWGLSKQSEDFHIVQGLRLLPPGS